MKNVSVATSLVLKRPAIITVLAILHFISATLWLLIGLVAVGSVAIGASDPPAAAFAGLLLGGLAVLQLACGRGLWKLRSYGRTLQLVFAWIGLIGIPIGTIISILILGYLFKPGSKVLFSGKSTADLTEDELTQVAAVTQRSLGTSVVVALVTLLVALILVAALGLVAAMAVPGLLRARISGNEASAIGSLRVINSAQGTFASNCAAGGYAVTLDDLAKPPSGNGPAFINPDLGTNGVTRSGYRFTVAKDGAAGVTDIGSAAGTCNASTGTPVSSYFASAEPVRPGSTGTRYFATDTRGIVFYSTSPIANPIVESTVVVRLQ
jgi:type II secretory pathway pseudopilin PulG